MECRDCPYRAEDFRENLWCDKVGGRVNRFGYCGDVYSEPNMINRKSETKKTRKNKRERYLKHKTHLKTLEKTTSGRLDPIIYINKLWNGKYEYIENPKPYYKRLYRGRRSKYLKKLSHRKIRRFKGELKNGWMCHKLYDFWWEYL